MITTWFHGSGDENMPEELLVDVLAKVKVHPWWTARARLALAALRDHGIHPPARILDAGCGWGTNLEALEKEGYTTTGLDISRRVLECIDRPERDLIQGDLTKDLPGIEEKFDALFALDVIEHIDDDQAVVSRLGTLLKPGGIAILSVPALPELFSEFDSIQGHRRRYTRETLGAAFEGTGLIVKKIFWWGSWMVPILRRMRKKETGNGSATKTYAEYLTLPPWPGPALLSAAYRLEHHLALRGKLRTGTSLFAIATAGRQ